MTDKLKAGDTTAICQEKVIYERVWRSSIANGIVRLLCIFGDKSYSITPEIQTPFEGCGLGQEKNAFNKAMTNSRMVEEYDIMDIAQQLPFCSCENNQQTFSQQNFAAYVVSAFFVNCHLCMYGFPLAERIFSLEPPSLESYFRSNVNIWFW